MSRGEVVAGFFEAFNSGDVDGALALLHPDAVLLPMRAQLEGSVYQGHERYRELLADLDEDWSAVHLEIAEIREGEDSAVALGRMQVHGRASGAEVDIPMGWVATVLDGKVLYLKGYSEPADALRAAGAASTPEHAN